MCIVCNVKLEMSIEEVNNLENICKLHNYSKAGFIREAIKEKIERLSTDNGL